MRAPAIATTLVLSALLPCFSVNAQSNVRSTELNEETYAAIRQAILLEPSEAQWEQIPWQPDFGQAIREARQQDKPILLWVMNGHPAGMT